MIPGQPDVPLWRRDPYRVFFPLGAVLAAAGVVPWLLLALGVSSVGYPARFHAVVLVECALLSFALGFLFTFIPRRTGTAAPGAGLLAACLLLPVLTATAAALGAWTLSQLAFAALLLTLLTFAARRLLRAAALPPESLVWVPLAAAMGLGGALLTLVPAPEAPWRYVLGANLVLQGLFGGLVLGVGSVLLPQLLHGEPALPARGPARQTRLALHAAAALGFVASFVVEARGLSAAGHSLRALLAVAVLLVPGRLWRVPTVRGLNRRLLWASAWMLPLGYSLVALRWVERTAGLHLVFVGSFALMTLAISTHVALSHAGTPGPLLGAPRALVVLGTLVGVAAAARVRLAFDPGHFTLWLGVAAGALLLALLAWAALVARPLLPRRASAP